MTKPPWNNLRAIGRDFEADMFEPVFVLFSLYGLPDKTLKEIIMKSGRVKARAP